MRRDCVTQVIVRWRDGEEDNFATPLKQKTTLIGLLMNSESPRLHGWRICRDVRNGITASSKMRKVD